MVFTYKGSVEWSLPLSSKTIMQKYHLELAVYGHQVSFPPETLSLSLIPDERLVPREQGVAASLKQSPVSWTTYKYSKVYQMIGAEKIIYLKMDLDVD